MKFKSNSDSVAESQCSLEISYNCEGGLRALIHNNDCQAVLQHSTVLQDLQIYIYYIIFVSIISTQKELKDTRDVDRQNYSLL